MRTEGLVANFLVLLTFVVAALLAAYNEPLYHLVVQEDEYLEWATFWGFLVAAGIYFSSAGRRFKVARQFPWFLYGLALFCFLVAMEEISWGQRLLGYKAPDFFLEQNYQQELNLHNVIDTSLRKLVLKVILLGYGVVLSVLSLWPPVKKILERLHIVAPPPMLIVSFLAMFVVYTLYPWSHTGEWVELTMAFGFVFAALFGRVSVQSETKAILIVFALVWALAGLTVNVVRYAHAVDPERLDMAGLEIEALRQDFASSRLHTRCGIHKRLYTFARKYQQPYLFEGEFFQLVESQDEGARAEYLLDPWNSAYWIRHKCSGGREVRFIYSFGPDRRRNSSAWEIGDETTGGDDIGAYLER